jgi:hypothetical protein
MDSSPSVIISLTGYECKFDRAASQQQCNHAKAYIMCADAYMMCAGFISVGADVSS